MDKLKKVGKFVNKHKGKVSRIGEKVISIGPIIYDSIQKLAENIEIIKDGAKKAYGSLGLYFIVDKDEQENHMRFTIRIGIEKKIITEDEIKEDDLEARLIYYKPNNNIGKYSAFDPSQEYCLTEPIIYLKELY